MARFTDEILVISGGKIIERGHHDELIATGGQYAGMLEMQSSAYQDNN